MAGATLAEIQPLDLDTGNRVTIRVTSANDRRVTALNGVPWQPALIEQPVLSLQVWNGDFRAAVRPGQAALVLAMNEIKAAQSDADQLFWIGAPIVIRSGVIGQAWPWTQRFVGTVRSIGRKGQALAIQAEVNEEPFRKTILTATYAGTGDAEGGEDIKNRVKPLTIGWTKNVQPVLINAVDSVYQFSAYGPIEAVTTLFERGSDFGASSGDHADYAALVAATIAPGSWGTCLAEGLVRLGAPEYGLITGDIKGHKVGSSTPRLTGAVLQALADIAGVDPAGIDTDSLDLLDSEMPYPVNLFLSEQVTWLEQAQMMTLACNAQSGVSLTGSFFSTIVEFAGTPDLSINARGRTSPQVQQSEEMDVSLPYWRTVLGADRSWRVHSPDEIALAPGVTVEGAAGVTVITNPTTNVVTVSADPEGVEATPEDIFGGTGSTTVITPAAWYNSLVPVILVDEDPVIVNLAAGKNFYWTIGDNRLVSNPLNAQPGQEGKIWIQQDATGGRVPVWGTKWYFPGGPEVGGMLSAAPGAIDLLEYYVGHDDNIYAVLDLDFSHGAGGMPGGYTRYVLMDFANEVYSIDGVTKVAADMIYRPTTGNSSIDDFSLDDADIVASQGLTPRVVVGIGEFHQWYTYCTADVFNAITLAGTTGFSGVIKWSSSNDIADNGNRALIRALLTVNLFPADAWFLQSYLVPWLDPGDPDQWERLGDDYADSYSDKNPPTTSPWDYGNHIISFTFSDDHLAMSIDGGAIHTFASPSTIVPSDLLFVIQTDVIDDGGLVPGTRIQSIELFDIQDDADLPGLSTP